MLTEELNKLEAEQLKRIAEIWGLPKIPVEKRAIINTLHKAATDEYFLKGVLEKLTPLQVKIYSVIVASKTVLTLGEISRKLHIQPINAEKELVVLKNLMLVYQMKNRERITNNLDKYYPFERIREIVCIDVNARGEKFHISLKRELEIGNLESYDPKYIESLGAGANRKTIAAAAIKSEHFAAQIKSLSEGEQVLIDEAFSNGGIIEINAARIVLDEQKLKPETTLRKLHGHGLLRDIYFIDERYVRVIVLPIELFDYLKREPIFPKLKGIKQAQQRTVNNELDFVLNLKKLLLFISNRGLTLSQSEKLKQADMKRSESGLVEMDMNLFPEKSQVHKIEIILPFLKLFDLVDMKGENVVLRDSYEEFLSRDPLGLITELVDMTAMAAEKRMVGNEVFLPIEIPFYHRTVLEKCVEIVKKNEGIYTKVLISDLIREWVILSPGFSVRNFKNLFIEHKSNILSALFYMHLFGMLMVEYPHRLIRLSELGKHYFFQRELKTEDLQGAIIINADASIVAMPEKLSLAGLHLLKSFATLKDFDRVYTFQITKESLQEGLLLGNNIDQIQDFLAHVSKNRIPQNLSYLISEWSETLPIVTIEEDVVLLETNDARLAELLVGQLKGKKVIKKELSDTAMIIYKSKISDVMEVAEKHEMIVKLIR